MSAFQDAFSALTISGMSAPSAGELLAKVIAESVVKPSAGALRTQRWRERRRHSVTLETPRDVTLKTVTSNKTNDLERHSVTPTDGISASPPLTLSPSKKDSSLSKNSAAQGYRSFDGSVDFSPHEIAVLEAECPLVVNVYGQITHLSESEWMNRIEPTGRKRAITLKIKKDQRLSAEKTQRLTTPKQAAAVHVFNMEALHKEHEEREQKRAFLERKERERNERRSHA